MNEEKSSDTNELEVNDEAAEELEEGETTNEQDIENFIKSMKATAFQMGGRSSDQFCVYLAGDAGVGQVNLL